MKSLENFLSEKREITIHTLASYIRQYIHEYCQPMLQEHQEELLRTFGKAGEPTYGVFSRMLFQQLQQELKQAGFACEPDYPPGDLRSGSVEYWGPPEERERCFWSVVRAAQGTLLGTIITQFYHDHTQFRLPLPPSVLALEETETDAIVAALADASVRLVGRQQVEAPQRKWAVGQDHTKWEYSVEIGLADCIDSKRIEMSGALLDNALSLWGRNGWELVSAVPYEGRVIAFFKRPAKGNEEVTT